MGSKGRGPAEKTEIASKYRGALQESQAGNTVSQPSSLNFQLTRLHDIFAEFDVPIGEVEEVFPAFVMGETEVDLHKGAPLRAFRLTNQVHGRFDRRFIGLAGVTGNTGADDVLPVGGTTTITGNDVIEIQVLALKNLAAVLAGVPVPLENIVPREFDFLLGESIKDDEQDHPWDADLE